MGLHGKNSHTSMANGASVMVIDQTCDTDQLLVSLSKNGHKWLSPVGWTDQQKVTLLDCRPNGEITEIDIPAEFASDIKSGDVLVLRCSELDLEKEIIWEASDVETRSTEEVASSAAGLASGLLSRFKGSKTETIEETKSEAELRAEEAGRAAQNYKAKMEAAAAAKEDAQRKALEAAREAEAALKMEAERIAEMERAAKAFEEAERLKQDELRRVEEERRAEEARLAEEARRIEEARKREIAAKKAAERNAALERYQAELEVTRNEEARLKSRLKDLKSKAKSDAENIAVQREDLQSRQGLLVANEEAAAKSFDSYEKSASKLDEINADLTLLQSQSETLSADQQALSIRLSQADADYQQAQKDAEAAIAEAESRRAELDLIRQEEGAISGKILSVSEKLSSKNQIVTQASEKTQKLQSKLDAAQAELAQAKVEIEALEQALAVQAEQDQNLRLEIEATQQAIEDSQARKAAHHEAIEHLEAGGSPEDIAEVNFEARNIETTPLYEESPEVEITAEKVDAVGLKDRMMGRVRSKFAREKDAEISIAVEDVVLEAAEPKADPVLLAGLDDTPSFVRRHSSSLMALGAVIGGIAILGAGLALNKSATPKLEVKSTTPAPTQVASAVTRVEVSKASEATKVDNVDMTAPKAEEIIPEASLPEIELPKSEKEEIAPKKDAAAEAQPIEAKAELAPDLVSPVKEAEAVIKEAKTAAEREEEAFIVKLAEVVDPTGFAFELPDMQPIAEPKKVKATKPAAEKSSSKKIEIKTSEAVKKTSAKSKPKVEAEVNYPELTSDVQRRLSDLGFYNGEIDGLQGKATKEAITNFKTVFAMPETSAKISGAFLTELKRVKHERQVADIKTLETEQAERETEASVQIAEVATSTNFYDTVQAVPSTPVVTDALPAANAYTSVSDPTPSYVAPQPAPTYIAPDPEPVKVASIPPTISEPAPAPIVKDVIVEAKMLKNASARYPVTAQRRNYFTEVAIVVGYDIGIDGKVSNLKIVSNNHSGRFNNDFEKEAMRAIQKMRYEPKTVNGVAVMSEAQEKRIVFRGE